MELHCEVHEGDGPVLLLVHGLLSSRAQWGLNLPLLARAVRPIAVELWGHGRSPSPSDPTVYHPDAYVAAFERMRERLGVDRWMVCGQSLGAALTLRYALDHPEHLLAQIFTNSTSALADVDWVAGMRASAARRSRCTMQRLIPCWASLRAAASPKPLEPPRIKAHQWGGNSPAKWSPPSAANGS